MRRSRIDLEGRLRHAFRRVLDEHGPEVELARVLLLPNLRRGQVEVRIDYRAPAVGGYHQLLVLHADRHASRGVEVDDQPIEYDAGHIWWEMYEDHRIFGELRREQEAVRLALRDAEPGTQEFDEALRRSFMLRRREDDIRQNHRSDPGPIRPRGVTRRRGDAVAGEMRTHNAELSMATLIEAMRHAALLDAAFFRETEPNREVTARAEALLKENLTPAQRATYEAHRYFDVKGGETGRTYRIRHGRQMNIHELDEQGNPVCGWCFLPQGGLPEGDVMIGQKQALELYESEALKVANKFSVGFDVGWQSFTLRYGVGHGIGNGVVRIEGGA